MIDDFEDNNELATLTQSIARWNEELKAAESESELFRALIEIGVEDLEWSSVTIYSFDEGNGELHPAATSKETADPIASGDHPIWEGFRKETPSVFDQTTSNGTEETERSYFVGPFAEREILAAELTDDREVGNFEIAVMLCNIAGSSLKQIQYKAQLRERDRQLERRDRTLERVDRITETYRAVSQATNAANTREELDRTVCNNLVENEFVKFVWTGDLDRTKGEISARAWAGSERGYLERTPIDLDDQKELSVRSVRNNEVRVVENVATGPGDEEWRAATRDRGFRSVIAVPLSHDGIVQGVLMAYSDQPNPFEGAIELAKDMGELIGHAITALQWQEGLLSHTATELDVEITAPACFFVRFVRETETSVSFKAMTPVEDGSVLVFVRADDPELLLNYAERSVSVSVPQRLESDAHDNVVKGRFDESFIGTFLSTHGIALESVSATPEEVRITVSIPPRMEPRRALEIINSEYPESKLLAKREGHERESEVINSRVGLLNRLTDRQREVVERAFRGGYFETPKEVTGESLATSMDISASAFHNHLRAAESELVTWLFDSGSK